MSSKSCNWEQRVHKMKLSLAITTALLIVILAQQSSATKFTRCSLAQKLKSLGFTDLGNWVCLAEHESGLNSNVRGRRNPNGSYDYGLFQVNDRYWCSTSSRPGKDCHVTCQSLLDDDITDDANCAKIIHKRHGFKAWYGWKSHCRGDVSQYVRGCGV